ncbi:uncharacterized protein J8A68_003776 [[Candida] subhashii]|uniref:Uncharacterized protein n=1 Tax=[Candida] subhashii TaxID=561895 RepID=A0A8J5ULN3_9ASCO|nr:uncharacterized protein J8A68_003776 [[Candida] subhashii]KAG7662717.1 hypothetical protein J8A68_003776 [[Candida] subhashii]
MSDIEDIANYLDISFTDTLENEFSQFSINDNHPYRLKPLEGRHRGTFLDDDYEDDDDSIKIKRRFGRNGRTNGQVVNDSAKVSPVKRVTNDYQNHIMRMRSNPNSPIKQTQPAKDQAKSKPPGNILKDLREIDLKGKAKNEGRNKENNENNDDKDLEINQLKNELASAKREIDRYAQLYNDEKRKLEILNEQLSSGNRPLNNQDNNVMNDLKIHQLNKELTSTKRKLQAQVDKYERFYNDQIRVVENMNHQHLIESHDLEREVENKKSEISKLKDEMIEKEYKNKELDATIKQKDARIAALIQQHETRRVKLLKYHNLYKDLVKKMNQTSSSASQGDAKVSFTPDVETKNEKVEEKSSHELSKEALDQLFSAFRKIQEEGSYNQKLPIDQQSRGNSSSHNLTQSLPRHANNIPSHGHEFLGRSTTQGSHQTQNAPYANAQYGLYQPQTPINQQSNGISSNSYMNPPVNSVPPPPATGWSAATIPPTSTYGPSPPPPSQFVPTESAGANSAETYSAPMSSRSAPVQGYAPQLVHSQSVPFQAYAPQSVNTNGGYAPQSVNTNGGYAPPPPTRNANYDPQPMNPTHAYQQVPTSVPVADTTNQHSNANVGTNSVRFDTNPSESRSRKSNENETTKRDDPSLQQSNAQRTTLDPAATSTSLRQEVVNVLNDLIVTSTRNGDKANRKTMEDDAFEVRISHIHGDHCRCEACLGHQRKKAMASGDTNEVDPSRDNTSIYFFGSDAIYKYNK